MGLLCPYVDIYPQKYIYKKEKPKQCGILPCKRLGAKGEYTFYELTVSIAAARLRFWQSIRCQTPIALSFILALVVKFL